MSLTGTRRPADLIPSLTGLVLAALCFLPAASGLAQEAAPAPPQAAVQTAAQETPAPPPLRPLEPTEIADSAVAAQAVLRDASRAVDATKDLAEISDGLSDQTGRIDDLERETRRRMQVSGPGFALEQTERAWQRLDGQLSGWMRTLSSNATAVSSALDQIDSESQLWEMTRDSTRAGDVPAEVTREIRQVLSAVDSVRGFVRTARDTVLKLQAAVAGQKARTEQNVADQRQEIARRRGNLLSIDSPPVWKILSRPGDQGLSERTGETWRLNYQSVRWFVEGQRGRLLGSLAILAVLIAMLAALRGVAGTGLDEDDSPRVLAAVLGRPIAAGFFVAGLVGYMAQPSAPRAWKALLGLAMLVAALRLIPRMLSKSERSWGYVAAALFFLQQAVNLSSFGSAVGRLSLLVLALAGLAATLRLAVSKTLTTRVSKPWARAIDLGIRLTGVAFAVGAIANIVGAVGLAVVVTTGTVHLIFTAVAFWLAAAVVLGAVHVATATKSAARIGITSSVALTVRTAASRLVGLLAAAGWTSTVLAGFGVLDPVVAALTGVLDAGISVGNFSLSFGDALIFGIVVWLSVKLSQLISFVLGTELLPLMHLRRGIPAAIVQLTRYAVILIGVLVAFSAAGVDVDRLTVLVGALGVGVGFGLQSVVGNFASGLIVLFGQRIKIGDEVQLEDHGGVVRDIGVVQTTVRTYHGADVLVPNATLLSSTVVNWTCENNAPRRIDIPLGVAYGTDPKTVTDLLEGVATKHPLVADRPQPKALFLDFGDSSLDFQLNVWLPDDKWYAASSELRVQVNDALVAAGIEVAVPQRDLHLRSIDEGVAISVSGESVE